MRKISFITLFVILASCCEKETREPIVEAVGSSKINDSISDKAKYLTSCTMLSNNYPIEFISSDDTSLKPQRMRSIIDTAYSLITTFKNTKLSLNVDTTNELSLMYIDINFHDSIQTYDTNYYKSYRGYITNTSKSITKLETEGSSVQLIQEALDPIGNWRPIEYWSYSFCGNSYHEYLVMPGDLIMIKIPKYNGEFHTKLRLRMQNDREIYISQPFNGNICMSQFDTIERYKYDPGVFFSKRKIKRK